ncbi:hypothetical protein GLOTRDRAFT_133259 [Gloeophyllum trabeum ATCC 11539]|uniref:Uncharacterized protein n=1 Tax=Gloeophyllum trabeum (strain ATCC 11539 / FP-39264 / Madison 617) TaxID=670483 RepID=S7PVI0_GLOTA|nr:uncharacterized protein GLOTRDRAFT_133259 [Gloeophyllum trabeum ATCC 11539]EPQ51397.1 hypothetical protein GLOTRDRAFT_133259 [Gloeophyllum trabeum ATCC 11539]
MSPPDIAAILASMHIPARPPLRLPNELLEHVLTLVWCALPPSPAPPPCSSLLARPAKSVRWTTHAALASVDRQWRATMRRVRLRHVHLAACCDLAAYTRLRPAADDDDDDETALLAHGRLTVLFARAPENAPALAPAAVAALVPAPAHVDAAGDPARIQALLARYPRLRSLALHAPLAPRARFPSVRALTLLYAPPAPADLAAFPALARLRLLRVPKASAAFPPATQSGEDGKEKTRGACREPAVGSAWEREVRAGVVVERM